MLLRGAFAIHGRAEPLTGVLHQGFGFRLSYGLFRHFDGFCSEFGYDSDSRTAERTYKACQKTLKKVERVFSCDLYDLINEIQETYNC